MNKNMIDNGIDFDFGKTSKEYAKFRDIYPKELYQKLYEIGVGLEGSNWLDMGTGTGVIPRGMAQYGANIIATDISHNQINEAIELSKGMENIKYKVIAAEDIDYEENTFDAITACQCFWYFDSKIVVPKIKRILRPGGIFLKVYMSYMKEENITQDSNEIVKQINNSWEGASPAIQDLKTHYFENPQMDTIIVDIPFTRESWHGRMLASRGVMAAMNEKQISEFGKRHMDMLCKKYPKQFTVKHKVFLTWYTMK